MEKSSLKDFGDLFILMLTRNSLELTFALGWTISAVALWHLAPIIFR
jgi:hypothetical protein